MRDIIILDTANQPYYCNRVFDVTIASKYPGALSLHKFYELAIRAGYAVMTSDMAVQTGVDGTRAVVVTEQTSPWTDQLARSGASLGVLFCLESPSFAWRFYRELSKTSQLYRHVFLFPGAASRVSSVASEFHPTLFPQPYREILPVGHRDWYKRKFAAMVHGNRVRRVIKPAHLLAVVTDPDLRCELYSDRRRAIRYFHRHEDFQLYGGGWQRWRFGVSYWDYRAALWCWQGKCNNKVETLSGFRFSICYENTIFPGYITEKIFDCFYAGCIPIYYGAPDICDYIPKKCFIDKRDFVSYRDLDQFLSQIGPNEFDGYRRAISDFLESKSFEPFYQDDFARNLLAAIEDCAWR